MSYRYDRTGQRIDTDQCEVRRTTIAERCAELRRIIRESRERREASS